MKRMMLVLTVLLAATGCGGGIPALEKETVTSNPFVTKAEAATTVQSIQTADEDFRVKTLIKGSSVFVECHLNGYSFRVDDAREQASIEVFLDGEKKTIMHTAAFVIKDIPRGVHTIELVVLDGSSHQTGLKKKMDVHITTSM